MGAGEVHPEEEESGECRPQMSRPEEEERDSAPHLIETILGPGRLKAHIFQRSSAGRREKRCWMLSC